MISAKKDDDEKFIKNSKKSQMGVNGSGKSGTTFSQSKSSSADLGL